MREPGRFFQRRAWCLRRWPSRLTICRLTIWRSTTCRTGGSYFLRGGSTRSVETSLDHGNARNAGPATPDLASLPGARTLRTSEPEKNSRLAEAVIKFLTGGEPIRARHLNRA